MPAIVLLGMKPYQLDAVAPALAPILDRETILVSILAGVELASLRARFPAPRTIVRAMPNLPVRIGKGVIGLCQRQRRHRRAGPRHRADGGARPCRMVRRRGELPARRRADRRRARLPVPLHRRARRGGASGSACRSSRRSGSRSKMVEGAAALAGGVGRRSRDARAQGGEPRRHDRGGPQGARRRTAPCSISSSARSTRRAARSLEMAAEARRDSD